VISSRRKVCYLISFFDAVEHRDFNELKSVAEIIDWLDERFVFKRDGEEGYGQAISMDGIRREVGLVKE